jgi:hypothetical protein
MKVAADAADHGAGGLLERFGRAGETAHRGVDERCMTHRGNESHNPWGSGLREALDGGWSRWRIHRLIHTFTVFFAVS